MLSLITPYMFGETIGGGAALPSADAYAMIDIIFVLIIAVSFYIYYKIYKHTKEIKTSRVFQQSTRIEESQVPNTIVA